MTKFVKGQPPANPNGRGHARNRIETKFLKALADDFEQHGADAIKLCRLEQPSTYVKIIASLLPRSLEVTATAVERDLSDEELAAALEKIRAWRAAAIEGAEAIPMKLIESSDAKDRSTN
jgi:hypothetical protein